MTLLYPARLHQSKDVDAAANVPGSIGLGTLQERTVNTSVYLHAERVACYTYLSAPYSGNRAVGSVVEHFVHTEGVTGSNPVSPISQPGMFRF